jgi:integrase
MQYPFGPMIQLLALTGCRLKEIAEARWSEISGDVLVVPPQRTKTGVAHAVPLTKTALAILDALPRFAGGDYIVSTMAGAKPVSGFGPAKVRIDGIIAKAGAAISNWRFHDLRRR